MIILVDSSALALLINPDASPPDDPTTSLPLTQVRDRVELFLSGLNAHDTIIVPTPVLAEVLVKADEGAPDVLIALRSFARIRIVAFDERAAVETSIMTRDALVAGDKRGGSDQAWQKVKFDRQIVAIARVHGVATIYADDRGLVGFATMLGMDVVSTWDLPLPEPDLFAAAGIAPGGKPGGR